MAAQVVRTGGQIIQVLHTQLILGASAVMLQGAHGGHDYHCVGGQPGLAALDVQELLRAQIRTEARFGHNVIRQTQAQTGGHHAVAAVGNVRKGPAVDDRRVVLQCLDKVRIEGILQKGGHGARRANLARGHRLAVVGVCHNNAGQPLLQVLQVGGQAENRHDLAGHGDVEAVLTGHAVHLAAQSVGHKPQLAVVHVHAALPDNAPGIDVMGVALINAVVHHGRQQVVGRTDGVQVTGEMQVDVLHGHHLCVSAAGRAALDAEHGPQAGLAQAEHGLFAQRVQAVRQTGADGGFALAGGGGADGGDQNQLALFVGFFGQLVVDLCFVFAVQADLILRKTQLFRNLNNGLQGSFLCDLNIRFHGTHPFLLRAAQTAQTTSACLRCGTDGPVLLSPL